MPDTVYVGYEMVGNKWEMKVFIDEFMAKAWILGSSRGRYYTSAEVVTTILAPQSSTERES